jgi:hypothetical protein
MKRATLSLFVLLLISVLVATRVLSSVTSPLLGYRTDDDGSLLSHEDDAVIEAIIEKWGLTTPSARKLLQRQLDFDFVYDKERDFLFFEHIMKTGGTSLSLLLENSIGGVFPGSQKSAIFYFKDAEQAIRNGQDLSASKVGFAHETVRNHVGMTSNKLVDLFKSTLAPDRRIRILTMIRDPVALRASNIGMSLCEYKAWIERYNQLNGLPIENCNVTLTAVVETRINRTIENLCPGVFRIHEMSKMRYPNRESFKKTRLLTHCEQLMEGKDPFQLCRSIRGLLDSDFYNQNYHNMHQKVMGRFRRNQTRIEEANHISPQEVEEYTLEDLGGLNPNLDANHDMNGEYDFLWFGITERVSESLCLLFYTLQLNAAAPHRERVMNCRPTMFWSDQERLEVQRREPLDYAVYRSANAIMDVRLLKMHREIQEALTAGKSLEDMPHVGSGCFQG